MSLILSKVIPAFLFPTGLVLALCLVTAWLAFRRGARAAGLVAMLAALLLYLAASPVVSNRLLLRLEKQYPPSHDNPRAAAIVLLGGGMVPLLAPRVYPETGHAGDRLIHAARLWRQGLAPVLVATGGYIEFLTDAPGTEADLYAHVLTELFGLPDSAVIAMGRSRTTHEDALFTAELFEEAGLDKNILLVTSATHMRRAEALFLKAGFSVTPAPTDYRGETHVRFRMFDLLPRAEALANTTVALHEYLGLWAYRLAGKV